MSGVRSFIEGMIHNNHDHIRRIDDKNWYWISQSILKQYGNILKPTGLAVYNVLASYANSKSQTCFPSQKTIAEKIGLCRETVNRKVKLLTENRLVRVKRLRGRCLYFLLKPDVILNHAPCDGRTTQYEAQNHTNNNKEIKIYNKNNGTDGFNNLKPIRQLLKRYEQKS
jgi:DNA-binding MarR family transcriptional regulator